MKSIKQEMLDHLINQLIDHPVFNKEKFLETNPQLKEVVEKAIKEREDRTPEEVNEQQFIEDMLSLESEGKLKLVSKDHMGISKYRMKREFF